MGINSPAFLDDVFELTYKHFPTTEQERITSKPSKGTKYLAITVTVYAENQDMLDAFYKDITSHPDVKMVL